MQFSTPSKENKEHSWGVEMQRATWTTPLAVAFLVIVGLVTSNSQGTETPKTKAAKIPRNNLSCFVCDTTVDGEKCSNLNVGNKSSLLKKCEQDDRTCMVKRFSYTTSTENSTSILRMWSLQRSCTAKCEPGCIVIGERTKLYACTACCNATACNTGKGTAPQGPTAPSILNVVLLPVLTIYFRDLSWYTR